MMLDGTPIEITVFPAARFPSPQPTEAMVKMPSGTTHSVVLPPETLAALLEFTEVGQLLARLHGLFIRLNGEALVDITPGEPTTDPDGTLGLPSEARLATQVETVDALLGAGNVDREILTGAAQRMVDNTPAIFVSGGKLASVEKINEYVKQTLARRAGDAGKR